MTGRLIAIVAALLAIGGTLAQYANPDWPGYHEWQYATSLVVALILVGAYAGGAARGRDGEIGTRLAIAAAGTFVVAIAGLASGLLGPDTETIARAPGTVAPLPEIGAAAFFPSVDAAGVAAGDAALVLRRKNGEETSVPPHVTRIAGADALALSPHRAAFVEARDPAGRRLTVTQPTNAAFLSPVLFFPGSVTIAGHVAPQDSFAVPALHRQVRTILFDRLASAHGRGLGNRAAVLFAVDDDAGRPVSGGIGFAPDAGTVLLGGLRLRATLGTYPTLVISSVPAPYATGAGLAIVLAGIAAAFLRPNKSLPEV